MPRTTTRRPWRICPCPAQCLRCRCETATRASGTDQKRPFGIPSSAPQQEVHMSAVPKEVFSLGKSAANFIGMPRQLLIDGKWGNAESGKTFQVINPPPGDQG